MRGLAVAVLVASMAVPAISQERLVETVEVRVVNVDVVVRDKSGNPVTGLTRADFEVEENGRARVVTNLYEVRRDLERVEAAGPSIAELPAAVRRRRMVLFVDNFSLNPGRKARILKSMEKLVDQMGPEDQTMIVLWNLRTKVLTEFTGDKAVLRRALSAAANDASAGFTHQATLKALRDSILMLLEEARDSRVSAQAAYARALGLVDGYSEQMIQNTRRLLSALARTNAGLAGVDGRKVLIFAGEHLPERPGAEMYQWVFNQFHPYMRRLPFDTRGVFGVTGNTMQFSIEDVAKEASANGVTMYTIDAADTRDVLSAEFQGTSDTGESFTRFANTAMAYQTLARLTGGLALANTANYDAIFEMLARDLNSYYSLGFKPAEGDLSRGARRITVRMKNPEYRARFRQSYTLKTTDEQMNDKVIANIYDSDVRGDWQITLQTGAPKRDGSRFLIPVKVSLAPTITLLPRDGDLVGGFVLYIVVGNRNGRSGITRSPQALKIPPSAEKELRSKPMTFDSVFMVSPGENTLSVGVIDQLSNASGFARADVIAR